MKPDKKSTIITLLKNGISQREISWKTKIDRKTVRKYANESGLFPGNGASDSKSPTAGEVTTPRGGRPSGPDCVISQNSPPWPPGISVSKEEKRVIPLHARSACGPHREWIEDELSTLRADFSDRMNKIYMIYIYPVDPVDPVKKWKFLYYRVIPLLVLSKLKIILSRTINSSAGFNDNL